MSYHCPTCDAKTRIIRTNAEVRTRRCPSCGLRFLTEEVELEVPARDKRRRNAHSPIGRTDHEGYHQSLHQRR